MRAVLISIAAASLTACAMPVDIDDTRLVDFTPEDLVQADDDGADVVPGQYIVVMRDGVGVVDFDHARFGRGLTRVRDLAPQNATVLSGVDDAVLAELQADHDVLMVYPDAIARIDGRPAPAPQPQVLPSGIDRVGADETANKGAGVVVCLVDTGIDYRHPDLAARYRADGSKDFVNNDNDPLDDEGHGTHCAGTIAATADGQGVVGVAPEATIVAEKVLNRRGSGSYSAITAGVNQCVAAGAKVISMSLGGPSDDPTLKAALQSARNAGLTIVVAAGNDGVSLDTTPSYPASYDGVVITVAAAWIDDTSRAFGSAVAYPTFTNTGSAVDLTAPGVYVVSDKLGGGTTSMSGTSMATPHVAGAAALYLAAHPGSSPDAVEAGLEANLEDVNNVAAIPQELLNVRGL